MTKTALKYVQLPQPQELSEREKEDAMGAYLMMFASLASSLPLPVINLIAAVVYYYVNRKKSRYVHFNALQSLLSQLPTTFLNWGLLYWILQIYVFENLVKNDFFIAFLTFAVVANLIYFTLSIVACIKSKKGIFFYFVFFGAYSYKKVYATSNLIAYQNEEPNVHRPNPINAPPF